MPKRRAAPNDDSDDGGPSSSAKRARTEEGSDDGVEIDDVPPTQTRVRRAVKGKQRIEDLTLDGEDEEIDDEEQEQELQRVRQGRRSTGGNNTQGGGAGGEEDEEEEDEQFEAQNGDKIRAKLESKRHVQGGVAEYGIIEYIEMHQFMCHKYLTFHFGPQINFIIGHNGSGKSAALSALTVALGGKANSTGRGNGIKSFIREGQSVSEVTVHLKNQGEEAYKPTEYGKTIVITRRFTKEGGSSWKIKSKDGKVISTKKEELAAICDHMNIQVDNPMNVLTQDSARQFLSASHPQDKYKFFLRGTQLSQLSDEYDTCLENITQTAKVLAQKKEALPDLRTRFAEASARYQEAAKAREQKQKLDDLKKELAWSHVKKKEDEMTSKIGEVAKASRRLPRIEESIKDAQKALEVAEEQVTACEAEFHALGTMDHLTDERMRLQNEMRGNKVKLGEYTADLKTMDASIKATNRQITELEEKIAEEARKMAVHTQARHEQIQLRLEELRAEVSAAEEKHRQLMLRKKELAVEADTAKSSGVNLEPRLAELRQKITECENMVSQARKNEADALMPYGKNIKEVVRRIQGMKWFGDVPIGPLGVHVKARDPERWGEILRVQLGGYLTAFAVTDARDREGVKRVLGEFGNTGTLIIIFEKDLFDYKSGEPPENYLTVLRALEISDPYVLRIMINQAHIEQQILANTRKEAQQALMSLGRGGTAWSADGFSVRVFREGGVASSPLNMRGLQGAMNLLLTGRDTASEIRHYNNQKEQHQRELAGVQQDYDRFKQVYSEKRKAIDRVGGEEQRANGEVRTAKSKLHSLQQEANDDLPAGMAGYEAAKEEAEEEKNNIKAQFTDVVARKNEVDEAQKELQTALNEVKEKIASFQQKRNDAQMRTENAGEVRLKAQNNKIHYETKLAEERKKVAAIEEVAAVLQEEFQNWTAKAAEYCERVENPRPQAEVQRLYESVQAALKEREKRHGASVEEMAKEVNKTREQLESADKALKHMAQLNKALKASLITRLSKWQEFRRHIALRCKLVFAFHLSQRGYYGKVLFNHDAQTLMLRVQTDDQTLTQGSKDKDPRSLSGGEKSFSTICLLLSLWESIGCPLRCLDEFDVFMDAVNRRISMKMMIDTANSSDKKQYILITPQDMTNIHLGPTVRVLRMSDPERGNGMLPFGSAAA